MLLLAAGWETAAFTDGGAVASELGLARGFQTHSEQDLELPALAQAGLRWLAERSADGAPRFAWVRAHRPGPDADALWALLASELSQPGQVVLLASACAAAPKRSSTAHADYARALWTLGLVEAPPSEPAPRPAQAVDLVPSVLELVGLERPAHLAGRSFLPSLRGEPLAWDPTWSVLDGPEGRGAAARWGRFRLLGWPTGAPARLHDLRADPGESDNAIAQHEELAVHLSEWMYARAEEDANLAARYPATSVELSADTQARLRARFD